VDLTHTLDPDFPTYSGESQFQVRTVNTRERDGWNVQEWILNEHTGTHIDAPLHRSAGVGTDAITPESLVGPLAVIDVRARATENPDAELTPDDIHSWESRYGRLPEGAIVALCCGWASYARTPRFRGEDSNQVLHFPGFHIEAIALLLEARRIKGIMVDTLSLDHGPSTQFPVHTRWLGSGRWGMECVANLEEVPACGAMAFVGAPKVAGSSGGPSRVFALW
jgi:kynurenine formamidase